MRRKEYCIFNRQYSRDEYLAYISNLSLGSARARRNIAAEVQSFWELHPRPHIVSSMTQGVAGNYIFESKDVYDSGLIRSGEYLRYCFFLFENVRNCYDFTAYGHNAELIYESARCGNDILGLLFCYYCYNGSSNLMYCSFCSGCSNCFGCVGLNRKEYCVFNQQYSPSEYASLVHEIVGHMHRTGEWGEFFPMDTSPFPYNHSLAQRYFPTAPAELRAEGLWYYEKQFDGLADIPSEAVPDVLPEGDNPLTLRSLESGTPFRISKEEVRRLRLFGAPLPRTTYDERMMARAALMGGIQLHERHCAKTGKPIKTHFPPDSKWIVWERDEYAKEFA